MTKGYRTHALSLVTSFLSLLYAWTSDFKRFYWSRMSCRCSI